MDEDYKEDFKNYADHISYVQDKMFKMYGVPQEVTRYADRYEERAHAQSTITHEEMLLMLQNDVARLKTPAKPKLTYEQKMNKREFTLSDIERLCAAFSLSIGNPADRVTFDTMVKNWRDERIEELS